MKYYVGIDLGGTNIVAGVVDGDYNIIAKASTKTNCPRPEKEIAEDMAKMAVQAVENAKLTMDDIEWIGITLGTGVGAGIVIDGKIYAGSNFAGAEIGHTVIEVGGALCTCGRKGCFEAYSSATGLIRMTKESMAENPDSIMNKMAEERGKVTARTSFDCMRAGDKYAKAVVDKYIKYLAAGITNTINTFQPDILCIGGGVCNEGDPLLLPVKAIVEEEDFANKSEKRTEIVIAKLGNDAGLIGAAFLGRANS